jgi:hypothetical protein
LVFSVRQAAGDPLSWWPHKGNFSLWSVAIAATTGEAAGKAVQLTSWSESLPVSVTVTSDGKRLSFLKERIWHDVYLGDLGRDGSSMKPPRRFTLDNRGSYLDEWTRDSKAILFSSSRNGKSVRDLQAGFVRQRR